MTSNRTSLTYLAVPTSKAYPHISTDYGNVKPGATP